MTGRERSCYISGPMRRMPLKNRAAFLHAERALALRGWRVFSPARMARPDDPADDGSPASCRVWAERDLRVIVGQLLAERGDVVVVLPGTGRGMRAEVAVAQWVRLPVVTLEEALFDPPPLGHRCGPECPHAQVGR